MCKFAAVRVPETPMHENHFSSRNKNQVRVAGKIFPVQTETIAQPVSETAHIQLGTHTLAADGAHIFAAVQATIVPR